MVKCKLAIFIYRRRYINLLPFTLKVSKKFNLMLLFKNTHAINKRPRLLNEWDFRILGSRLYIILGHLYSFNFAYLSRVEVESDWI